MRPLTIAVHNWLSYGPGERIASGAFKPTINFEAFELACITGPNGHGKSAAVVDALRYALFGKARHSGSRELDQVDLKRKGADEAAVQLRFEVEGLVYTITRTIGRRGHSAAELTLPDQSVISGVREVDAKLHEILGGLDDVAFMASCVVGQGDATQFMQRSPGERKDILYNVLGLQALSDRSEAAKRRGTQFASEAGKLEAQISLLRTQTDEIDELKSRLSDKQTESDQISDQLRKAQKAKQQADIKQGKLLQAHAQCGVLLAEAKQHRLKVRELRSQRSQKALSQQERELKDRATEIKTAYDQYGEAAGVEQLFADAKVKVDPQLIRINQLTIQIESARQAVLREREATLKRGTDDVGAEHRLEAAQAVADQLEQAQANLTHALDQVQQSANNANLRRQQLTESLETQGAERRTLNQRMSNLQEQVELGQATCPLCGQDLTGEHASSVEKDLQAQLTGVQTKIDSLQADLAALPSPADLARGIEEVTQKLQKYSSDLDTARLGVVTATQARVNTQTNARRIVELDAELSSRSYSVSEQGELLQLTPAVRERYDEAAHTVAISKRQELQAAEKPFLALGAVLDKDAHRTRLTQAIREFHRTLSRVRTAMTGIGFREDELEGATASVDRLHGEIEALQTRVGELGRELATIQANIVRMDGLLETLEHMRKTHADYIKQHNLWIQLSDAYGEKGLQAFLTRRAIVGLQKETNERLRDWTDGQLSAEMSYEESRGLVVVLKDSGGEERKFHACSGGEQFRVALSIRIALSRLMANRIGVKPRILIIDEGFGTQDEDGIDGLERTLKSLVGAFSNIIVITHIESMQKRFDYHITVSKTSLGSQLSQPSF